MKKCTYTLVRLASYNVPVIASCNVIVCSIIVHWDHKAKTDDDISVKKGDTVTLVDHHRVNVEGKLRVSQ